MNLFDEYKQLFSSENPILKNPYMINRLLSFSKNGFSVSVNCNKYIGKIPNELLILIYKKSIKSEIAPYVKYARLPKVKEPLLTKKICNLFNCGKFHAKQYIIIYRKLGIKIEEKFGLKVGE